MKKFKFNRGWWYPILTIFLPIAFIVLYFVLINRCGDAFFHVLYSWSPWIGYVFVPVGVNIAFGPSVYAFWSHQKKSRVMILILNLLVIGWMGWALIAKIDATWWPAWARWAQSWWFWTYLLLVGWALRGKAAEKTESKPGLWMLIAHVCAVAAVAACVNHNLIASTLYKNYHRMFHYRDYLTRLALYTGDLNACDSLGTGPYTPGVMRYPFILLPTGITDDEFEAQIDQVPSSIKTYFLQMAHLEAARVRLGGKSIFHWRIKDEVFLNWPLGDRIQDWIKDFPLTHGGKPTDFFRYQNSKEVIDDDGKYIGEL